MLKWTLKAYDILKDENCLLKSHTHNGIAWVSGKTFQWEALLLKIRGIKLDINSENLSKQF